MTTIDPTIISTAATTKKAYNDAVDASNAPIRAWHAALIALKLIPQSAQQRPQHPLRHALSAPSPAPTNTVTTADLPHLADAKLAAEAAVVAAKAANDTAQAAVKQALAVAGVL